VILPLLLLAADPPAAEPAPVDTLRSTVVDAIRNCPKGRDGEIVVCSRDRGFAEGFRIPKLDPRFARNLRPSGRGELASAEPGAAGIGTCTNTGAGGTTGCTLKQAKSWGEWKKQQKAENPDALFPW
jgi:hypothetical protein